MENFLSLNRLARLSQYLYDSPAATRTCDTANNPFVPFFNLINGQKVVFDGRMLYEYSKYIVIPHNNIRQHRNDYLLLMSNLTEGNNILSIKLGEVIYQAGRGILMEYENFNPRTIVALCIARDAIFKFDRNNIDTSKMIVLVDYKFATDDKYKTVFKKINTIYLTAARVNKVAIMYTDNVDSWCFNENQEEKIRFRNVAHMKEFLNKFNTLTYGEAPEL